MNLLFLKVAADEEVSLISTKEVSERFISAAIFCRSSALMAAELRKSTSTTAAALPWKGTAVNASIYTTMTCGESASREPTIGPLVLTSCLEQKDGF